jgi:hypothetical protein
MSKKRVAKSDCPYKKPLFLPRKKSYIFQTMRKTSIFLIFVIFAFSSCASTKSGLFSEAPIALVSVVSNYDINWKDEEATSDSAISRSLRRALGADEDWVIFTRADTIIDEIEEIIRKTLEASPLVSLAPKENVLGSRAYNEARIDLAQQKDRMVKPDGYRLISHLDKNFYPILAKETGIERSLFITLDLTKEMYSGFSKNGNGRAKVEMTVVLKDSRGKNLFYKAYTVSSSGTFKVTSGAYSQEELLEHLRSAINYVCQDFLDNLH